MRRLRVWQVLVGLAPLGVVACGAAAPALDVWTTPPLAEPLSLLAADYQLAFPSVPIRLHVVAAASLASAVAGPGADLVATTDLDAAADIVAAGGCRGLPRVFARLRLPDSEDSIDCMLMGTAQGDVPAVADDFAAFVMAPVGQRLLAAAGLQRR